MKPPPSAIRGWEAVMGFHQFSSSTYGGAVLEGLIIWHFQPLLIQIEHDACILQKALWQRDAGARGRKLLESEGTAQQGASDAMGVTRECVWGADSFRVLH